MRLSALLTLMVLAMFTLFPSLVFPFSGESAKCVRADFLPVLDGDLAEWGKAFPIPLTSPSQIVTGSAEWQGKNDASALVYTMWDEQNLYVAAEVNDDCLVGEVGGYSCNYNDGIELYLDTELAKDFYECSPGLDDFQIGLMAYPNESKAAVWSWTARGISPGGKIIIRPRPVADNGAEAGYNLEVFLPWSEVGVTPREGLSLGFLVGLDDQDDPKSRAQKFFISWNARGNTWQDPTQMGIFTLVRSLQDDIPPLVYPEPPSASVEIVVDAGVTTGQIHRLWEGLAEGGETQKYFPESVSGELQLLGTRLVRVDHLLNRYNIMPATGQYKWEEVDRLVDGLLAGGAKPLFCLSYMPACLSRDGTGQSPPSDYKLWEDLIYETVNHFNVDRNLGIEYWEVWNEPDGGSFWKGTLDEYFKLYEFAARGAKRADPNIKIGGPAVSNLDANWLIGLLRYASERKIPMDFISWHGYNMQPIFYRKQIETVRQWTKDWDMPNCELVLDEWNVKSDMNAKNDTEYAGVFALETLYQMMEARLDVSCFFEVMDGLDPGGKDFWGRWGLLTYTGIRKPAFNAFHLLSFMGEERLDVKCDHPYVRCLATTAGDRVAILIWQLDLTSEPVTRQVNLTIDNLRFQNASPDVTIRFERYALDKNHCNAYLMGKENQELVPVMTAKLPQARKQYRIPLEGYGASLLVFTAKR